MNTHSTPPAALMLQASAAEVHLILQGIVRMAAEPIVVMNEQQKIVLINPAAEKMFACTQERAMAEGIDCFMPEELREALRRHIADAVDGAYKGSATGSHSEIAGVREDGESFSVEVSVTRLAAGGAPVYAVIFSDVTARRQDEARLNLLVNFDPLTSLPNRALFHQRLQRALARAQRYNKTPAVLFIDLDRFKDINDTLGHAAGDVVLKAVAAQLAGCLREVDTLARLGGDEFAVLVEEIADTRLVAAVARKLHNVVAEPILVDDQEYRVTASIGVSTYPADGRDAATLIRNAEAAMVRAKEQGRDNTRFPEARTT